MIRLFGLLLALLAPERPAPTYQAIMMRAAPGHLPELIGALERRMPVFVRAGEPRPVLMRHSQGDQWDLLLLIPIGTLAEHFGAAREARWHDAVRLSRFDEAGFNRNLDQWVSWQEELYVEGPPVATFEAAASANGYFHLEIFRALAGKRDSLLRERAMENEFLAKTDRPTNFIFRKVTGSAWDAFTIGFYRDLQHYAEPARVSAEVEDQAARAAGFASRSDIGPYLRRFIDNHHDTLGSIVK